MARCASMTRWHDPLAEVRVLGLGWGCVPSLLSLTQGAVPGQSESGVCLSGGIPAIDNQPERTVSRRFHTHVVDFPFSWIASRM